MVDSAPRIFAGRFYKKLLPALRTVIRTQSGKIVRAHSSNPKGTEFMKKTSSNLHKNESALNVAAEYFARFDLAAFGEIAEDWERGLLT